MDENTVSPQSGASTRRLHNPTIRETKKGDLNIVIFDVL
jgi:hypothetical protein